MPFRSEKQRRFLYAVHPDIAAKWEDDTHTAKRNHKMPSGKSDKPNTRKSRRKKHRASTRRH